MYVCMYVSMYVRLKKKIREKCFEEIRVTIAVALLSRKKSVCCKERNVSVVKEEVLLKFWIVCVVSVNPFATTTVLWVNVIQNICLILIFHCWMYIQLIWEDKNLISKITI